MAVLSIRDVLRAWGAVDALAQAGGGATTFARQGALVLPRLVPSDLTTLSVCDLQAGRRAIVGRPPRGLGRPELAAFDRHLHEHPLVRAHRRNPRAATCRLSDLVDPRAFRRTALYVDYYRPIGIEHVIAVPLLVERRWLVGFVLQRAARAFDDGERALLELLRPQLSALYRLALAVDAAHRDAAASEPCAAGARAALTHREREVAGWLGAGKTNRDIAAIVGASPRTVEKHLEHIYQKLGVETRTAAVMRLARAQPRLA
jgi:DNA-binding CsgD family transcriptional regulator